jgi:hypothetical protein
MGAGGGDLQWPPLSEKVRLVNRLYKVIENSFTWLNNFKKSEREVSFFPINFDPFGKKVHIYTDEFPTRANKIAAAKMNMVRLEQNPF